MCLMCEFYFDTCMVEECLDKARAGLYRDTGTLYANRIYLWQSGEPCEHIRAQHGPGCAVLLDSEDREVCNCYLNEHGEWFYD